MNDHPPGPLTATIILVILASILASPVCALAAVAAQTPPTAPYTGHWEGSIEIPGTPLGVRIDLVANAEGLSGTIDIPMQGAEGLPLSSFELTENGVRFEIQGVPGRPTFAGHLAEGKITGDFTQGPAKFSFTLGREPVAAPVRPQDPKPPFPYKTEEVRYSNGAIELAGTLTLPAGAGPFPAALLITGSGAQNRDEELLGHKPFLVLADHLTRGGIAVLRVDDRGVGGSSGSVITSTSEDFAGDALAGVAFLQSRPEILRTAVGVIGHSEGGLVGPLAASRSRDIAFVVMLAGPGVSGREILPLQLRRVSAASGMSEAALAAQAAAQAKLLDRLASDASDAEIEAAIRDLVTTQLGALPEAQRPQGSDLESVVAAAVRTTNNPWFRFFVRHDPRPALSQLEVPVLALNGELDLQVDADQNLPVIEAALRSGGNQDATVVRMPGLNHLFQHATIGSPAEYAAIDETMSPEVLDLVRDWIRERFPRGSR